MFSPSAANQIAVVNVFSPHARLPAENKLLLRAGSCWKGKNGHKSFWVSGYKRFMPHYISVSFHWHFWELYGFMKEAAVPSAYIFVTEVIFLSSLMQQIMESHERWEALFFHCFLYFSVLISKSKNRIIKKSKPLELRWRWRMLSKKRRHKSVKKNRVCIPFTFIFFQSAWINHWITTYDQLHSLL